MSPFSFLRSVYDLENLDTRYTTPSSVPYKAVVDSRTSANGKKDSFNRPSPRASPSKWQTTEFYLYYLVIATAVPYMFWVAYDVSRPSDPRYAKFSHLLSDGWIPGRKIDISDSQYHTFRENLPYMAILLLVHPAIRMLWNAAYPVTTALASDRDTPETSRARLRQRTSFDYAFALLFLVALHGFSAAKVLVILYANYSIATLLPRKHVPVATWVFNIAILFANELCEGYKFRNAASFLAGSSLQNNPAAGDGALVALGQWLDSWGGLMPRWEILFNITILRLISFNLDYYWSLDRRSASPVEKKQLDPAHLSERDRVSIPAAAEDYTFRNYVAYAVYAPLYLVGPIITFNDYISQSRYRAASIETPRTIRYAVRSLLCLLAMEVILHFDYVGAISKAGPVWASYTAAQLSFLSYFNLHLIWLKLLIPWRLFRLWALVDGIDPPENMLRCVSDNYSTLSFWRAWHRSYNRWLIRYIWIPLGGSDFRSWVGTARSFLTYLLVFTFVALWHDIQLRLLIWGWLVVFFMIPEVLGAYMFPRRKWEGRLTAYRMLCCAGAVGNILMMMAANMVGFAVGLDGLQSILRGIFADFSGILFLLSACVALFVGVQVMFEIRESELRRGISLKC